MSLVRAVSNLLGAFVFKFIGFMVRSLYNLILMLADINFLDSGAFDKLKDNVFGLIGLFMIFKLTFSIIQYITNPDKMADQQAGVSKILTKVVVVLVLLGTINTIFKKAFELQGAILKEGVLERLVFGQGSGKPDSENIDPDVGFGIKTSDYLAYSILAPFVTFNTEADIWGKTEGVDLSDCDEFIRATDMSQKKVCHSHCVEKVIKQEDPDIYNAMCAGLEERNMYKALIDVAMLQIDKTAVIHVDGLFGLLIGAICIVVLVVIAVGVAIRSVKLSFLSLIAPLPIITYIEPKDNSNSMFNKWLKETIKTFLELFIRLISFYFAIMIITKILTNPETNGVAGYSGTAYTFKDYPLVIIFLIIGCFLFALQLPKLIENLFGSMGGFMRDTKSTSAIASGIAGVTGGIVGGAFGNMIGTAKMIKDDNNGKLGVGGVLRSGLAFGTGAVGTGVRSTLGAFKTFKPSGEGLNGGNIFEATNSAKNIASTAITRTGDIRNARAVTYATAGNQYRSAYPILPSIRGAYGKFAQMAGIKDSYSPKGRIQEDIKKTETLLRDAQNKLSALTGERAAALQQYNNATHELQNLQNNVERIDKDRFAAMGGTYNEQLQDYVFNVDGVAKKFSELTYADYNKLYTNARGNMSGDRLAEFEGKFNMTNSTNFNMLKGRVDDDIKRVDTYNRKLTAATNEEAYWKGRYNSKDSEYRRYQGAINDMNKDIARHKKDIERIDRVNQRPK